MTSLEIPSVRALALILAFAAVSAAADSAAQLPTPSEVEALIQQGQAWLLAQQQAETGSFLPAKQFSLGITELAVEALATPPVAVPAGDAHLTAAVRYILSFRQPNGAIYRVEEGLAGYGTSLGLLALTAVHHDDQAVIKQGQTFLFGVQNHDPTSVCYGGIGYGEEGPGEEDLHNTSLAIAALRGTGVPASDPHLQAALRFVESCQNLSTFKRAPGGIEEIDRRPARPWVANDGGGVYSPTESKAGGDWKPDKPTAGTPRLVSYGSITHALIDSYLALDIPADDERVRAALAWVRGRYAFDLNPGMSAPDRLEGLFYYYGAAAKTFDLIAQHPFALADGRTADWRADLFAAIAARAKHLTLRDGSAAAYWINSETRWGESVPHLPTAYVIAALKRLHRNL